MCSKSRKCSSIKSDEFVTNSKKLKSSKLLSNEMYIDNKCIDITSRLRQFAWRQIIPSNVFLPVIFR
jgi:hypothetical protein